MIIAIGLYLIGVFILSVVFTLLCFLGNGCRFTEFVSAFLMTAFWPAVLPILILSFLVKLFWQTR